IGLYLAESRATAPNALDQALRLGPELLLHQWAFTPSPVASGDAAVFQAELRVTRHMRFDEVAVLIHDALGRRVGVLGFRQPSGLREASPEAPLRLTADVSAMPLVEGEYRIGASIRSGDMHHIVYDITTLDIAARRNTTVVPYRAEVRGL